MKNVQFDYYVDHIASFLKANPNGNYKNALINGVNFIELDLKKEFTITEWIESQSFTEDIIVIEEGGRVKESEYGIKKLADEINIWANENQIDNLNIFLPSGTGTTALFLQKNVDFDVYTCSCVGDADYLKSQFVRLDNTLDKYPKVLDTIKKYHFGKLYKENYELYKELKDEMGIEFDLLYDPIGWNTLLNAINCNKIDSSVPIVYIHQGGIKANVTMIERYQRKYF